MCSYKCLILYSYKLLEVASICLGRFLTNLSRAAALLMRLAALKVFRGSSYLVFTSRAYNIAFMSPHTC